MRYLACLMATAAALNAGMIRGVVLENKSGRPLARASVHVAVYTPSGLSALSIQLPRSFASR
jgi:hypothetical protein